MIAGFLAGILGGMGMGGGTILIPILTIMLGIEQHVAQAANLLSFLPMALITLKIHKDNGLLKTEGLLSIIIPALIFAILSAIVAYILPSHVLKPLFGWFLMILSIFQFVKF
jgi:hypothetical protein